MKKTRPDFKKYYELYTKKYGKLFTDFENKKVTAYVYIILTLLTVSFFGLLAIKPTLATVSTLQKQKSDSELILTKLKQKLAAISSLDQQYAKLGDTANRIYEAVPTSPQIPTLTRQLEILANRNQVTVNKMEFGTIELYPAKQPSPGSKAFSFLFTVSIEGDTPHINAFITSLINFDRIVTLERVTTSNSDNGQNAVITGRAYFYTK